MWPENDVLSELAKNWAASASSVLLAYVWEGCDTVERRGLIKIGGSNSQDHSHIETSITQSLVPEIRKAMLPESPYQVEHGAFEFETVHSQRAQPPAYDIAFVMNSNRRVMWPIEAKVLRTEGTLADYINEITNNYLTCRYGPFTSEGAMLGYLLKGKPCKVFQNIEKKLKCRLVHHPVFSDRDHKTSDHQRTVPTGKPYPRDFRCHHLVLMVGKENPDEPRDEP